MKAQMFILTIIFLVGLVYVVQQNLSGYSTLDFSEPFENNDYYIFRNVKDMFNETIRTTEECNDAEKNIDELINFLGRKILYGGFTLDLRYNLNCLYWDNTLPDPAPVDLTIKIIGKRSETVGSFEIYHLN